MGEALEVPKAERVAEAVGSMEVDVVAAGDSQRKLTAEIPSGPIEK